MTAAQPVTIRWQVTTVEEYSMTVRADQLPVGAITEVLEFPDGNRSFLDEFVTNAEGSHHGYLTSELTSRNITAVEALTDQSSEALAG